MARILRKPAPKGDPSPRAGGTLSARSKARPGGGAPRPGGGAPRPGGMGRSGFGGGLNPNRAVQRTIRQQGNTTRAQQIRPAAVRPTVVPPAPPRRIMPTVPARPVANPAPARPGIVGRLTPTPPAARGGHPRTPTPPLPPAAARGGRPMPSAPPPPQAAGRVSKPAGLPSSSPALSPRGVAAGAALAGAGLLALQAARAHPAISAEVSSLQYTLTDLQARSSFSSLQNEVQQLEAGLNHAANLLESARSAGYKYQKSLDEQLYQAFSRWQTARHQVQTSIQQQAAGFQASLGPLDPLVQQLNAALPNPQAAAPLLRSTQSRVNSLLNEASTAGQAIQGQYTDLQSQTRDLTARLNAIHWALAQLAEAKFRLAQPGEDLVLAAPARWDRAGADDPEGVLYLSNRRLIFERKEKVATKKILFITLAAELVQEVLIQEAAANLQGVKAANKGLFGHQDFLEVTFGNRALGGVPFHLDGQSSSGWAAYLERVRSGSIEEDRVTGSGLSFADFTGNITRATLVELQREVNELQDVLMLKHVRGELEALENEMGSLERDLASLRARGYAIEKSLEGDVAVLKAQWERVKANAGTTLTHQAQLLGGQMTGIQAKMAALAGMSTNLAAARPVYLELKSALASAEAQAEAAEATVIDQYDEYAAEVEGLGAHLKWVGWMLEAFATASFPLLATESGVAAVEATFALPGREIENGILYLTDQRLLWEDRVGDYELKIDLPLQQIKDVKKELGPDDQGADEFLVFTFSGEAPLPGARLDLAAFVADDWLKMIGRARSGGYAQDRAVALDPAELERIRRAPTQCPNCGAAFTAPLLRGQTEIACEYCGKPTRL